MSFLRKKINDEIIFTMIIPVATLLPGHKYITNKKMVDGSYPFACAQSVTDKKQHVP